MVKPIFKETSVNKDGSITGVIVNFKELLLECISEHYDLLKSLGDK